MRMSNGEKLLWFTAGVGLGAGLTFLFATKAGRRVRRRVMDFAEESRDRLTESGQEVLERGKQFYERGKEVVDEAMEFVDRTRRAVMR